MGAARGHAGRSYFMAVADKYGVPITEGYGLSEGGPVISHNPIRGVKKIGSIGIPLPDI